MTTLKIVSIILKPVELVSGVFLTSKIVTAIKGNVYSVPVKNSYKV